VPSPGEPGRDDAGVTSEELSRADPLLREGRGDEGASPVGPGVVSASSPGAGSESAGNAGSSESVPHRLSSSSAISSASTSSVSVLQSGPANASSAERNCPGRTRPRRSALRRIPPAARGFKKNLGWTLPSKMSDNEDAAAALGDSEILSVEESPDDAPPRPGCHTSPSDSGGGNRDGCAHEGTHDLHEVHSPVTGEGAPHVLPDGPLDPEGVPDSHEREEQSGPLAAKPGSPAGAAEVLTRGSPDEHVGLPAAPLPDLVGGTLGPVRELRDVVVDRDSRPMPGEHASPPPVPLAQSDRPESATVKPQVFPADAAAH
jgi:hypothetical protein